MSSPGSKRIVSPKTKSKSKPVQLVQQLSSSPRGNQHGRKHKHRNDLMCCAALFLRNTKWLLLGIGAVAVFRLSMMGPSYYYEDSNPASTGSSSSSSSSSATAGYTVPLYNNRVDVDVDVDVNTNTNMNTNTNIGGGAIRGSPSNDDSGSGSDNDSDLVRASLDDTKTDAETDAETEAQTETDADADADADAETAAFATDHHHELPQSDDLNKKMMTTTKPTTVTVATTAEPPSQETATETNVETAATKPTRATATATSQNATRDASLSVSSLSTYRASNAPVLLDGWTNNNQTVVQVHLVVDVTFKSNTNTNTNNASSSSSSTTGSGSGATIDPASKLLLAGIERSKHLQLTALTVVRPEIETVGMAKRDPKLDLVILIDWGSMDRDCHRLQLVLETIRGQPPQTQTQTQTQKTQPQPQTTADTTEEEEQQQQQRQQQQQQQPQQQQQQEQQPYLLLVDSTGSTRRTACDFLFATTTTTTTTTTTITDPRKIRLAKRSIVRNRYYDRTLKRIHPGELAPNVWEGAPSSSYDRPILHSPLALRESFVMSLHNITGSSSTSTNGKPATVSSWKDDKRTIDVGFFWKHGDYSHYGMYRRDIAKVVKTLHHSTISGSGSGKPDRRMENSVQISYTDEKGMEAGTVQYKYTLDLLRCKIVVIAQRDEWEDHYRLMESLASGALVMTDRMVALPEGLEDGVGLLVYDSPKHLKELLKTYLKPKNKAKRRRIARKGYETVMGRHRSWHRLEELVFGRPLTNAFQPEGPAPEKEVVLPGLEPR